MRNATILIVLFLLAGAASGQVITVKFTNLDSLQGWDYEQAYNAYASYIQVDVYRDGIKIDEYERFQDGIELTGFHRVFQVRQNTESDLQNLASNATKYYGELAEVLQSIDTTIAAVNASVSDTSSQDRAHTRAAEDLPRYRQREQELYQLIDTTMEGLRTEQGSGAFGWYYVN